MPCCTEPSDGSDLMSERLGMPSTKYGPSVCCGVALSLINVDASVHVLLVEALIVCAKDGELTNDIYDITKPEQMMAITNAVHIVFGIFNS